MKLAFISDIHGNFDALKAVMLDIKKNKVQKIYCLGDIVNYYYEPHKCIDLLIKKNVKCIKEIMRIFFSKHLNQKKMQKHIKNFKKILFLKILKI